MINRRHIRVKVMQSAYALLQSKSDNLVREEKFLYHSIDKMYDLYALSLRLLVEVRDLEKKHIKLSQQKFLATSEEKSPNKKFINNQVFDVIAESASLKDFVEINSLHNWELDDEYIKEIWKLTKESELYTTYMASEITNFQQDKEFVVAMFKQIVAPNDKLADYFEDKMITWVDDIPFVNTWVVKTLNGLSATKPLMLGNMYKDEDDKKFVVNLFRKVVLNHTEYEKVIEEKTPNWDVDRIAEMDMLLIKMAMAEFMQFPSIPTSVTINEYIEISKDYSTSKSSYFINGVLDKILKDLTASKSLNKIGRGLI